MAIVAFVDPRETERDRAVDAAIAIAHYSVAEDQALYLLSDRATALVVGLALVGTRPSRTLEGAEYRASPIVLLPFLDRDDMLENRVLAFKGDDEIGGGIEELYDLGVFSDRHRRRGNDGLDGGSVDMLKRTIVDEADIVIGLGAQSPLWQAVGECLPDGDAVGDRRIVSIESDRPRGLGNYFDLVAIGRRREAYVRDGGSEDGVPGMGNDGDAGDAEERKARERGAIVAEFFDFLARNLPRG